VHDVIQTYCLSKKEHSWLVDSSEMVNPTPGVMYPCCYLRISVLRALVLASLPPLH